MLKDSCRPVDLLPAILLLVTGPLPASAQDDPHFVDVADRAPLARYRAGFGDGHGPGGVFTDLDNDGFPELVLVGGPKQTTSVYRNVAGSSPCERAFELLTLPARRAGSTGAVAGDFDNDGDVDLYVLRHPTRSPAAPARNGLWSNQLIETGALSFVKVPDAATDPTPAGDRQLGLSRATWQDETLELSLTAAWADVDRDGDLDLYVGNHDRPVSIAGADPPGQRDVLYLNNNDGADGRVTFTDFTMEAGATGFEAPDRSACAGSGRRRQCYAATNAVIFADLDNDRWPDLVVTNKMNNPGYGADMLYVNRGADSDGRWLGFENRAYAMSAFGHHDDPTRGTHNAMGIDAGDFDNDGDLDLYVTDAECARYEGGRLVSGCRSAPSNNLLVNQLVENGGVLDFLDLSDGFVGDLRADFSWGAQWLDADNNGRLDLHVATAGVAAIDARLADFLFLQRGGVFRDRAGTFGVAQVANARGNLAADYNRDGAVDLFVVNQSDVNRKPVRSRLYENRLAAGASTESAFLSLRLVSHPALPPAPFKSTRDAVGARVRLSAPGVPPQVREVVAGGGNAASTASLDLEFGLGSATEATVEVAWPSGRDSTHRVAADQFLTISEQGFAASRVIGRTGSLAVGSAPVRVRFGRDFTDPVVFAGPPSVRGPAVSVVRVTEVGPGGFSLRVDEAPNRDGAHPKETVSWLVLEAGSWRLADGTRLAVGQIETGDTVNFRQWTRVTIEPALGRGALVPVVLTQVQTGGDASWVKTRQRRAAADGFQVGLEVHEAAGAAHGAETVGWLAMEPARGLWNGLYYAAGNRLEAAGHGYSPIDFGQGLGAAQRFIATLASFNSSDPAGLRYRGLTSGSVEVKAEEDTTADSEVRHRAETVSFLVFSGDGDLSADSYVPDLRPTADFTAVCDGLSCTFDAAPSTDDAALPGYGYSWVFGDGNAGNGRAASHAYDGPGTFEVRLTVVDSAGQARTLIRPVQVTR